MDWKEFSIKASEQIVNLIRYIAWPAILLANLLSNFMQSFNTVSQLFQLLFRYLKVL